LVVAAVAVVALVEVVALILAAVVIVVVIAVVALVLGERAVYVGESFATSETPRHGSLYVSSHAQVGVDINAKVIN